MASSYDQATFWWRTLKRGQTEKVPCLKSTPLVVSEKSSVTLASKIQPEITRSASLWVRPARSLSLTKRPGQNPGVRCSALLHRLAAGAFYMSSVQETNRAELLQPV